MLGQKIHIYLGLLLLAVVVVDIQAVTIILVVLVGGIRSGYGAVHGDGAGIQNSATQVSAGTCTHYSGRFVNGKFGIGQGAATTSNTIAGGGGGWYGGGAELSGGGGSGYVYTASTASDYPNGCKLDSTFYLTNAQTIAGDQSFPNVDGTGNETGHSGNGAAKITPVN